MKRSYFIPILSLGIIMSLIGLFGPAIQVGSKSMNLQMSMGLRLLDQHVTA